MLHSNVKTVGEVFDQHFTFVGMQEVRCVAPGCVIQEFWTSVSQNRGRAFH